LGYCATSAAAETLALLVAAFHHLSSSMDEFKIWCCFFVPRTPASCVLSVAVQVLGAVFSATRALRRTEYWFLPLPHFVCVCACLLCPTVTGGEDDDQQGADEQQQQQQQDYDSEASSDFFSDEEEVEQDEDEGGDWGDGQAGESEEECFHAEGQQQQLEEGEQRQQPVRSNARGSFSGSCR
jgi:hypothetical protein